MNNKKLGKLLLSMILAFTTVVLGGCDSKENQSKQEKPKEETVTEIDLWKEIMNSVENLKKQNKVTIYHVTGTPDSLHYDYKTRETEDGGEMEYCRSFYNNFYSTTTVDNLTHEITYINTYGADEYTSVGNKFVDVTVDDDYGFGFGNKGTEYSFNLESVKQALNVDYEAMKQGSMNESYKYIVKDGIASAYVNGEKKYENLDISSIDIRNASQNPPLTESYAVGPLDSILESKDFGLSWITTLTTCGRTLWGTEFPTRNMCSIQRKEENGNIFITYTLDKESNGYKKYMKKRNEEVEHQDLSWELESYFDEANIQLIIDNQGNLQKVEFNIVMGYFTKGLQNFKTPQYSMIEFKCES